MLASLYNVPQKSTDFLEFSFANMDNHRQIFSAIKAKYGRTLELYPIDPLFPNGDAKAYDLITAYNHQIMHDAQNSVLGITGNDLTTVDWTNPEQVSSWVNLHAFEHYQAASILQTG